MLCDICGRKEQQYIAIIEGSTLNVCQSCVKFGKVLRRIGLRTEKQVKKSEKESKSEIIDSIVPDFPILIRKKRESMRMNHEEFAAKLGMKTSVLHKIETGQYMPDTQTAKKIERILDMKLIEKVEYKEERKSSNKDTPGMTIGDFIKVNRR